MRRGCARLCSHSGSSRSLGGESRKSWDTCLTSSPKRSRGKKGRKPRARGKGKEAWRGWVVEGPRVPPGPKSTFALKRSDFKENPASEASAFPGRAPSGKARLRREVRCASKSQKYGDVKNTRDVSCTLCIRSAGSRPRPREEVERRLRGASPPPRALRAAGGGAQSAGGAGRGKRGKGPGGRPGVLEAPGPLLSAASSDLYCSVSSGGARPGLEKGRPGPTRQRDSGLREGRSSPGPPQPTWPPGFRQRGKGARARAQGLYVNGDSGGGRSEGSGAAGRTRSGPGV